MNTSATTKVTTAARLRVKLAGGAAGLAIAGVILAACSATSAGAAKSATSAGAGQYRQAAYDAPATRKLSELEQYRAEHTILLPTKAKLAGKPGDSSREELRKEHLAR
jgi:hypothetical protein